MAAKKKTLKFEQALESLEEIVEQLEDGELSLEESLKAFEQGIKLTRECQAALKEAEQKVRVLIEKNGELYSDESLASDFEDEDEMDF